MQKYSKLLSLLLFSLVVTFCLQGVSALWTSNNLVTNNTQTQDSTNSDTGHAGIQIKTGNYDFLLANFSGFSNNIGAISWHVGTSVNGEELGSGAVVSGNTPKSLNITLPAGGTYYLTFSNNASSWTVSKKSSPTYPLVQNQYYNISSGVASGALDSHLRAVSQVTINLLGGLITLNSPIANYSTNNRTVRFNATATIISGVSLTNMSIKTNQNGAFTINRTLTKTGILNESNFTIIFPSDGNFVWAIQSCDSTGICGISENRSITIDTLNPVISISYPSSTINYGYIGQNISLNYSVTEINSNNCWFIYNGINYSSSCSQNSSFNISTPKTITVYANDTSGNIGSATKTWNYKVLEVSQSYPAIGYEGGIDTYYLNVTSNGAQTVSAMLYYNGTAYSSVKSGDNNQMLFSAAVTHSFGSAGLKNLYWTVTYGTENYSSTFKTQTISPTNFGFCNSTLNVPYLNFTFKDEATLLDVNASINSLTVTYDLGTGSNTYTFQNSSVNPSYGFCFSPSYLSINASIDLSYAGSGYPTRLFSLSNTTLSNQTSNQLLYLLSSGSGSYTTIQVLTSSTSSPIAGATVTASRDISGSSTIVAEGVTGGDGGVTFWLNPTVAHTFQISASGCSATTTTITPSLSQYTVFLTCTTDAPQYVSNVAGIFFRHTPKDGVIGTGNTTFDYTVESSNHSLVSALFQLVYLNGTLISSNQSFAGSSTGCSVDQCNLSLNYNLRSGDNIKARYFVNIGNGLVLLEGDAYWRSISTNSSSIKATKGLLTDIKNLFSEWGSSNSECGIYQTSSSCIAVSTCKWDPTLANQWNSNGICIPADEQNKQEFSRIVAAFFILALILALVGRFTGYDAASPGIFVFIMWAYVGVLSMFNGINGQGMFYFKGLTPYQFFNNYILFLLLTFVFAGVVARTSGRQG